MMRDIQEIFNLAIEKNYYTVWDRYMCNAISRMNTHGVITDGEYENTFYAIHGYINPDNVSAYTLASWLIDHCPQWLIKVSNDPFITTYFGEEAKYAAGLIIYKDWVNRPMKETDA